MISAKCPRKNIYIYIHTCVVSCARRRRTYEGLDIYVYRYSYVACIYTYVCIDVYAFMYKHIYVVYVGATSIHARRRSYLKIFGIP